MLKTDFFILPVTVIAKSNMWLLFGYSQRTLKFYFNLTNTVDMEHTLR